MLIDRQWPNLHKSIIQHISQETQYQTLVGLFNAKEKCIIISDMVSGDKPLTLEHFFAKNFFP
jgi:hypothetical protein